MPLKIGVIDVVLGKQGVEALRTAGETGLAAVELFFLPPRLGGSSRGEAHT